MTLTLDDITDYVLIPPPPVTSSNYTFNLNPPRYYHDRWNNVMFGRLDQNGELVFPNCLDDEVCGGGCAFTSSQYPYLPIYVRYIIIYELFINF
jgi:hypothetical protein